MPSVLQSPTTEAPPSFDTDFFYPSKAERQSVADHHRLHDGSKLQNNQPTASVQSWYNEDDEFGVPIFTKQRLIPEKAPLSRSSFLLHHPTLQRSVEIMVPPGQTTSNHDNPIHPTMPDGPIYIHHRSALPNTPLQRALQCTHLDCREPNHRHGKQSCYNMSSSSTSSAAPEYTFLQNHVGMIGQWLASMEKP